MSRPGVGNPGNKGGRGKKGVSGRRSAYQEHADQRLLEQMFFEVMSEKAVRKKLKSGKYSLKDIFVSKGFAGNERVLIAMFHKLFPDNSVVEIKRKYREMTDEELDELLKKAEK